MLDGQEELLDGIDLVPLEEDMLMIEKSNETYVGRCEAAADEAEAVLGDAMPSHIDFAPPPEPPKVQRSRAGSEASLGSRA